MAFCNAETRKGTACRNKVPEAGDRCHLHLDEPEAVNPSPPPRRRTRAEQFERGVTFAGSVASLAPLVVQIVKFVITHWGYFTMAGRPLFKYYDPTMSSQEPIYLLTGRRTIEEGRPRQTTQSFNIWFERLPNHIQHRISKEFSGRDFSRLRKGDVS